MGLNHQSRQQQRSYSFSDRLPSERLHTPPSVPRPSTPTGTARPSTPTGIKRPSTPIQKRRRSASLSSEEEILNWLPDKFRNRYQDAMLGVMARRASKLNQPQPNGILDPSNSPAGSRPASPAGPVARVRLYRPRPQRVHPRTGSRKSQLEPATDWIVTFHDSWSRLTNNSFFDSVANNALSNVQFGRWLLDRVSISMAILEGATRASQLLSISEPGRTLPLLETAKEDAKFLAEYATLHGLDINSQHRLSHEGKRLTDMIDASTSPDGVPVIAITAVWSFMLCSWHSWELVRSKHPDLPTDFSNIADHIKRFQSLRPLLQTRKLIDTILLTKSTSQEAEKAGKTFQQVLDRASAVLNFALSLEDESHVPICTCGRKGHQPSQCTFKSHI